MQIVTEAPYLGYVVGPKATLDSECREPLAKFSRKVQEVISGRESPSMAVAQMNAYAAPILQYMAQLTPDTDTVQRAVRMAAQLMMQFSHRGLSHGLEHPLHE